MDPGFAGWLLEAVVGFFVWSVANVVYWDKRRNGERGFARFLAFWFGQPTTWIPFFTVREGARPTFDAPDDEEALLAEIRRDRRLRGDEPSETASPPPLASPEET